MLVIRRVGSLEDLRAAYGGAGAQFDPVITADDSRIDDLIRRFPDDRSLMVVIEDDGTFAGSALAFRGAGDRVTVRMVGVTAHNRRRGLGCRLMETIEVEAMTFGALGLGLGAEREAKPFYESLGYHGHSSMHKDLPLPGRVLELRIRKLREALGDLDAGAPLALDQRGHVVPLFTRAGSGSAAM